MISSVKFNTKEKAEICYHLLGSRAISITTILYKGSSIEKYLVIYFKSK